MNSAPFAADFLTSMGIVKDFWAEPSYAELLLDMQKRIHDYVVADKGTAKEALDELIKDWDEGLPGRRQDLARSLRRFGAAAIGLPRWLARRGRPKAGLPSPDLMPACPGKPFTSK